MIENGEALKKITRSEDADAIKAKAESLFSAKVERLAKVCARLDAGIARLENTFAPVLNNIPAEKAPDQVLEGECPFDHMISDLESRILTQIKQIDFIIGRSAV